MKRIILFCLILIFILAGCFFNKNNEQQAKEENRQKGGLIVKENNTMLGWLKRGKAVECIVTSPDGEIKIKTKNNKVRIEGIPFMFGDNIEKPTNDGVSVTDGDWMYMWSGNKGTKMNIKELEEMSGEVKEEEEKQNTWEDNVKEWEESGFGYDCKEVNLSNSEFSPPNDVEFIDFSESLKSLQELGQQMAEDAEAGKTIDMEEIQKKLEEQGFGDIAEEMENVE